MIHMKRWNKQNVLFLFFFSIFFVIRIWNTAAAKQSKFLIEKWQNKNKKSYINIQPNKMKTKFICWYAVFIWARYQFISNKCIIKLIENLKRITLRELMKSERNRKSGTSSSYLTALLQINNCYLFCSFFLTQSLIVCSKFNWSCTFDSPFSIRSCVSM